MPSSDHNARQFVQNSSGVWTPVGYGATDAKIPTTLADASNGTFASVDIFGNLSVLPPPMVIFADTFESGTLDTQDRWTMAGTVNATVSSGVLNVQPGATANATTTLVSQPTFSFIVTTTVATQMILETTAVTGTHRFFGMGTTPSGTGTAAAPLQDAVGFEVDTAGALRASMYSAGTRTFSQALTYPTDGAAHTYLLILRGDFAFFYVDSIIVPVAVTQTTPAHTVLPLRVACLNGASPSGTPTLQFIAVAVLDDFSNSISLADGQFPWREAKIDATGALRVTPRSADQVATAVGSAAGTLTLTIGAAGTGLYHYITRLTITKYGAGATSANATPLTVTSTNLPGSLAWTIDTATSNGASVNVDQEYGNPLKSSATNTATTIACPSQANALWRVTAQYYTAP